MNVSYKAGGASGLIQEEVVIYDDPVTQDTAEQVIGDATLGSDRA